MRERAYTVPEIDALRSACQNRFDWGYANGPQEWQHVGCGGGKPADIVAIVEEMVRTHMMAGHTADDLIAEDEARAKQRP